MRSLTRRGVTLLELLVVMTLLGLLGVMLSAVVVGASRVAARHLGALSLERTAQGAAVFLWQERRDAPWIDLAVATASVRLPRPVGDGVICQASGNSLWLRRDHWSGDRAPEMVRDRLLMLTNGQAFWRAAGIQSVAAALCPDGAPAWRLVLSAAADSVQLVRVLEEVVLRRYAAGGSEWLGLAPADGSSPVQPFAGPLVNGASRFARVGDLLRVDLLTSAGARDFVIPLAVVP
jgi:prepilin-type N-terminal cleavage/methylation domain-containing protein